MILLLADIIVVPKDYTINPGDLLMVSVYSRKVKVSEYNAYVDNRGYFPLILGGAKPISVKISGLTLDSASKVLLKEFSFFVKDIGDVSLNLLKPSEFFVYLYGNVQRAGAVKVNSLTRLSDLIFSDNVLPFSSLSRIKLNSREVSIWEGLRGNLDHNPLLKDGDSIFIPKTDRVVYVVGFTSGGFVKPVEYEDGDDVYTVIWKLGISSEIYRILKVVVGEKEVDLNHKLSSGDTIFLVKFPNFVIVTGEVKEPKKVEFEPGLTVIDYINLAGGFTERANRRAIFVKRFGDERAFRVPPDYQPSPGDAITVSRVYLTYSEILSTLSFILTFTTFYRVFFGR
jgi:Periplasmic protein involved in polysaccharide export